MRVRRETGDFSCVIKSNAATIPANLSAEDLIGLIIVDGTAVAIVTNVAASGATKLVLTAGAKSYNYTIATGAVATASN